MCDLTEIKKIIKEELIKNNKERDDGLFKFKEELFVHIQKQIRDVPIHQTSPKTVEELSNIKKTCSERGTELALMNQLLNKVCEQQNKQEEKLDKIREENRVDRNEMNEEGKRQHEETMQKLQDISDEKADKSSLDKLEGFVSKVMWISVTSLFGFFISIIWFLINMMLKN